MNTFDLVFILFLVVATAWLIQIAVFAVQRKATLTLRSLRRLAVFVGVYLASIILVSLLSPQTVLVLGKTRRFDDWCIAVTDARVAHQLDADTRTAPGQFVQLTLHVFSTARRVSQAAPLASVHLLDAQGNRYDVFEPAQRAFERTHGPQAPLGTRLDPLGSFTTVCMFRVPAELDHIDVVTPHGGGPGALIVGDDSSFLHKPTVTRVPLRSMPLRQRYYAQ